MSQKKKYFQTISFILLMTIGLLGCSGKAETQPEVESEEQSQEQSQTRPEGKQRKQKDTSDDEEPVMVEDSEEQGFDTPEEAVLYYLAGLRDNDFGRMESTFKDGRGAGDIVYQYAYLCDIDTGAVQLRESEEAEAFLSQMTKQIEGTDFGSMEFLGFIPPYILTDTYGIEEYQDSLMAIAQSNDGSELQNQVAAIEINGAKYVLFFDLIKIDDRWYIFQLGGVLPDILIVVEEAVGTVRLDERDEMVLEDIFAGSPDPERLPEFGSHAAVQSRTESEGFDTPQAAAISYLEGLKNYDAEQMLSTFSVESYAQNYNMQTYMEHLQIYSIKYQDVRLPPINDFTKAMISYDRREQLKEDMLRQAAALYVCGCFFNDTPMTPEDTDFGWEELPEKVELDSIEVLGYIPPEEFLVGNMSKQIGQILDRQAGIYGADQVEECVVVFICGGEEYFLFMEEVQYNGKWYNSHLNNNTAIMLGVYSDYMGTAPVEMIDMPAEIEELIVKEELE